MSKTIAAGLCLALTATSALAQPAPTPKPDDALGTAGDRPWATGVSPENQRQALAKFREANAQLNDGLFAAAVALYREALTSWDHPAINYNLALALLNLDQPLEVYENLRKAVMYGPAPLEKEKFDHAQKYLRLVSQQIATVDLTCAKPGAKVSLDGKEVFTVKPGEVGRYSGRVRIGKHTVVAEKPGHISQVVTPVISSDEKFSVDLDVFTSDELTRYKRRWSAAWMPYAVIGGGVLIGAIGGALTLSADSTYQDYDAKIARCNTDSMGAGCTDSSILGMRDTGDTKRSLGYVGYGIAGTAIATGLVLAFLNRSESYQVTAEDLRKEAKAKRGGGPSVSLTPMLAPGAGGAAIFGSF